MISQHYLQYYSTDTVSTAPNTLNRQRANELTGIFFPSLKN